MIIQAAFTDGSDFGVRQELSQSGDGVGGSFGGVAGMEADGGVNLGMVSARWRARRLDSREVPMVMILRTPASSARARTAGKSSAKAGKSR
ncbi:MAG: hypothetical protein HC904_01545 [Blastochloris sp.]|nr:hypothetical protein [Blastochloris sp.]